MASTHCRVSRPSSIFKCVFAGFGLMLAVAVGSFSSLFYIFFTSMFLIVSTVYFTLISAQNPNQCTPNCEDEEVTESVAEQGADKEVCQIQGQEGCGSMLRALTISENESNGDDDDDQCITASEEEDDNVARSFSSSEDDGSISDEDTLIELELPTGHYLSPKELHQHKLNSKQKLPEQRWMKLLSEANNELATEEDNFIEIDISIGSIMHPRFEIQA